MSDVWGGFAHPSRMPRFKPRPPQSKVKPNRWTIEQEGSAYSIYRNGRPHIYSCRTREDAEWEIRVAREYALDDVVLFIDPSGNEEAVTL